MSDRMTWLLWLNYYVLRWANVRLARVIDTDTGKQVGWKWIRRHRNEGWL